MEPTDILILSNGPGEVATWVRPVVQELRRRWGDDRRQLRLSLVLSPCSNASGQEVAMAQGYRELDRIQGSDRFYPFLLWGKTAENWGWRSRGVVLFLGGDQFFPVVIGRRLGYKTVIYGEHMANWTRWVDRFGVMTPQLLAQAPPRQRHKYRVVGDLMAEVTRAALDPVPNPVSQPQIALLPGSKPFKLRLGLPLVLAIAQCLQQTHPSVRYVIPVAPTLTVTDLARYAQPDQNPLVEQLPGQSATLHQPPDRPPYLQTPGGTIVELDTQFPAYDRLRQCALSVTTLGANTAELGALAVPMVVLIPTNHLEIMTAWDGVPGLLANAPGIGTWFARTFNRWMQSRLGLMAWPNIWAGEMIVPELLGILRAETVAQTLGEYLDHPERLQAMADRLRQVRGEPGAAQKLVDLVAAVLGEPSHNAAP
ncbi:lipid-A-disaccharide synthase [Prochlorothrix hollandica]|uniref:lipid-A-disaccharide synthase n=1 Tax=Prochlorothrix hollandica TaxID=1223 RepID=UPI0033400E4D